MKLEISHLFQPSQMVPRLIPLAKHNSNIHGVAHWTRVVRFGLLLADLLKLSDNEKVIIALFGWSHDLARTDDGNGSDHAYDGAEYVQFITDSLFHDFPKTNLDIIKFAIRYHSDGMNAEEAIHELPVTKQPALNRESLINTLGCCWDADRLDLMRLGIIPNESKMSTPYWQEVLPLAAKLNKMTSQLSDNMANEINEDNWFI